MFSVTASPTAAVARAPPSRRARRVAARASAEPSDVSTASTASTASPATDRVTLGTSDLSVSATGVGAWAWGDRSGYWTDDWKGQRVENLEAYKTLLRSGVDFIDTAEVYGFGKSEELLAELRRTSSARRTWRRPRSPRSSRPFPTAGARRTSRERSRRL